MNPGLKDQLDRAAAGHARLLGPAAYYQVAAGGDPVPLAAVVVQELGDAISQERYGQDAARVVQITIRQALIPGIEPAHGDTVTIAAGTHCGTWTVLGVDARTEVALNLAARRATRATAAAPGARVVRR